MIKLTPKTLITVDAAAAEGSPRRSISGVAVTYDEVATVSDGTQVKILQGALPVEGRNPKLYMQHQSDLIIGQVVERVDTSEGMLFTAKISATRLGDDAMEMVKDGTIDAVSIGINPTKFSYDDDGVMIVEAAQWTELSLVSQGAFEGALITEVAASIPQPDESLDNNDKQDTTKDENDMSEKVETPVIEAAQATTEKLWAQPKKEFKLPSAGEYMAAFHRGGDTFKNINAAVHEFAQTQRTPLQAAAGDIITSDTPGLLPIPVLAPLVQDINFLRPVVQAIGARAYPDGGASKTFVRPTITTHTSVAAQANELDAASATTMVIAANTVTKTTLAGQVTLSVQDIDFTSPAAMQLILNDLMGEYMITADDFAADALLAAASNQGGWDGTLSDLLTLIYGAAQSISNGRNWLPTHMFVSVDVWAQLGKLADTTGRPVFPLIANGLSGQNALGAQSATSWTGNPLGLELIVDSNFAAKTIVITRVGQGAGDAFEFYESIRGLMSVEVPATLGRTMSFHGYVSTFAAIPGMIKNITQA
jgi:HK97 family phage prohead protease